LVTAAGVVDADLEYHDGRLLRDHVPVHPLEQVGDAVSAGGDGVHLDAPVLQRLADEGDVSLALGHVFVLDRQGRQRVAEEDDLVALLQLHFQVRRFVVRQGRARRRQQQGDGGQRREQPDTVGREHVRVPPERRVGTGRRDGRGPFHGGLLSGEGSGGTSWRGGEKSL